MEPTVDQLQNNLLVGDSMARIDGSTFRVYSQNINGLSMDLGGAQLNEVCESLDHSQVSLFGFQESNRNWSRTACVNSFQGALRKKWSHTKYAVSNSLVESTSMYQPGGTCIAAVEQWATRVQLTGADPVYGRWSYLTMGGSKGKQVTFISAYRVGQSSDWTSTTNKAAAQQKILMSRDHLLGDPRRKFIDDIIPTIQRFQAAGHSIVLMMDANESRFKRTDSGVDEIMYECTLVDTYSARSNEPGPATYRRGKEQIDYVLCSPELMPTIQRVTFLPFNHGHVSDHRGLVVDFDAKMMFGNDTAKIPPLPRRVLLSTNPVTFSGYIAGMRDHFGNHGLMAQVEKLQERFRESGWTQGLQIQYDRLDVLRIECMLGAENTSGKSRGKSHDGASSGKNKGKAGAARSSATGRCFSPQLEKAHDKMLYFKRRMSQLITRFCDQKALAALAKKLSLPDEITQKRYDRSELYILYKQAKKDYRTVRANEARERDLHLEACAQMYADLHCLDAEKSVRELKRREIMKRKFAQLRQVFKPGSRSGLDRVEVPDPDDPEPDPTKKRWISVHTAAEVHGAIIDHNRVRFTQHAETPFGSGDRSTNLGTDCDSLTSDSILDGSYDELLEELSPEGCEWLKQLRMDPRVREGATVDIRIDVKDFVKAWSHFRESTSSSPSNAHYGHYKAASVAYRLPESIRDPNGLQIPNPDYFPDLAKFHTIMCSLPAEFGFAPTRWQQSINLMLLKASGSLRVDKLRIIHLFEADFNFVLKLLWGKRLVHHAEDLDMLGEDQHGSRPGRRSADACLEKRLVYDFTRLTRTNMITVDNDAKACYDRIIKTLALLACISAGLPRSAAKMHNKVHNGMQHWVKSAHGVSDDSYCAPIGQLLEGTGQGSGASPAIWLIFMVTMLRAFAKFSPGIQMTDPGLLISICILSVFYVDDGMPGVNDAHLPEPMPEDKLIQLATNVAQSWERLLFTSGGSLEISKCFAYILIHDWKDGRPILKRPSEIGGRIMLTQGDSPVQHELPCISPDKGERTLGVRIAPLGNCDDEYKYRLTQSTDLGRALLCAQVDKSTARLGYQTIMCPIVEHPLGITQFSMAQCKAIQRPMLESFLQKSGYPKNFPRALVFVSEAEGGLGAHHLFTEQGAQKLGLLVGHKRQGGRLCDLLNTNIRWCQRMAGISEDILRRPDIPLSYVEDCWIMSIRPFLTKAGMHLECTDEWNERPQREHDAFLMDAFREVYPTDTPLYQLNACRLWMKVTRLSEVCLADGTELSIDALSGHRYANFRSQGVWPRQEKPPDAWFKLWKRALKRCFSTDGKSTALRQRLGEWRDFCPDEWRVLFDPESKTLFQRDWKTESVQAYGPQAGSSRRNRCSDVGVPWICDLPSTSVPAHIGQHHQHLGLLVQISHTQEITNAARDEEPSAPSDFEEYLERQPRYVRRWLFQRPTEEHQIQAFVAVLRANRPLSFASDGGLIGQVGSFGWVWTNKDAGPGPELCGAGPVDGHGPFMSSTRTELLGVLSALTFIRLLCEYAHIPFQSVNITGYVDNRGAITRTEEALRPQYFSPSRRLRIDYDIENEIRVCYEKMSGSKIAIEWVKGHQAEKRPYDTLSPEAKLNDKADDLAGKFLRTLFLHPQTAELDHWPAQKVSVVGANGRLTGRLLDEVRRACHSEDLDAYWTKKFNWDAETVYSLDSKALAKAIQKLSDADRRRITKLRCGWLPVNTRVSKWMEFRNPECPCCDQDVPETVDHLLRCATTLDKRSLFISTLAQHLTDQGVHLACRRAILHGLRQWFAGAEAPPITAADVLDDSAALTAQAITLAVDAQNRIGWGPFLRGFIAREWACVPPAQVCHSTGPFMPARERAFSKVHWTISSIGLCFDFFFSVWTERNACVHGHNADEQRAHRLDDLKRRIEVLFLQRDYLLERDRTRIFNIPLGDLLLLEPNQQDNWIRHATAAIPSALVRKERGAHQQPLITSFFPDLPMIREER